MHDMFWLDLVWEACSAVHSFNNVSLVNCII